MMIPNMPDYLVTTNISGSLYKVETTSGTLIPTGNIVPIQDDELKEYKKIYFYHKGHKMTGVMSHPNFRFKSINVTYWKRKEL